MKEEYSAGKPTAEIFRRAIGACGGAVHADRAKVKIYIDQRYDDFPWMKAWEAQIAGALAGEAQHASHSLQTGQPCDLATGEIRTKKIDPINVSHLEAARGFVEHVGGGSLERAHQALEYLEGLSSTDLQEMGDALEVWSELVEAADGNAHTVENVLAVLARHCVSPSAANESHASLRVRRAA